MSKTHVIKAQYSGIEFDVTVHTGTGAPDDPMEIVDLQPVYCYNAHQARLLVEEIKHIQRRDKP